MLATLIGSSAHAGEEIIPAAAVAAVLFKNVLRLIVIASSPPHSLDLAPSRANRTPAPEFCRTTHANRFSPKRHLASTLVQLPVTARLDSLGKPEQSWLLKMTADQHQPDRQTIDPSARHGEGRMARYIE